MPFEPARRRPPLPALVAVLGAVLTALLSAFFSVIALAFSNGQYGDGGWLVIATPVLLAAWLLTGALLLLIGRSWLALLVPAAVVFALVVWGTVAAGLGSDTDGFVVLLWVLPAGTAVLAGLPGVRRWVAARRGARLSTDRG
ncbi:hypothetical protein O2W18_19335 [Modestobacter sp. VKM Ac-2983]|uniref:hypothetical protein n=1 Tax=Modestobacter sp. VKM Ac-2983 TaxID=3004137 RepID=UPI0022ABC140|nr:hypothetical protein [Modestobacter sp. VKM Ac-2983]MCZ2807268.1 hypothetical protein [Modestobacter sp. VKM Ac-2983]